MQDTPEAIDFSEFELPQVKGVSPHVVSTKNDRDGLEAIHKFGWMRAREIGNVLWPNNPTRHIAGARIARRWLKSGLVMSRTLPRGHGPAFVLTKLGADLLINEFGIHATSGKKIGDHIKGQTTDCWRPTLSWQHDLIANSFLSLCLGNGKQILTELEISRKFKKSRKIPDGLFEYEYDDGHKEWVAIEVERADKYSRDRRSLIESILQAQVKGGIEFDDILVKNIYLVYRDPLIVDENGENPQDHFERLKKAIEGCLHPTQKIKLVGLPVLLKGGAVIEIREPIVKEVGYSLAEMAKRLARPDKWLEIEKSMCGFWSENKNRSPFDLKVANVPNTKNWEITLSGIINDEWSVIRETIFDKAEQAAKEAAINKFSKMQEFRNWVFDKHVCINGYVPTVDDL